MSQHDLSAEELTLPIKRTEGETLEDRLTGNAYHNILPARYLRKNADGNLVEQQEDLFERVGKNIALAEAVFAAEKRDIEITVTPDQLKPDHPRRDELAEDVFGAGTSTADDAETTLSIYNVNKFAYDTVVPELPEDIRDHVEDVSAEFQGMMANLDFMPNSPTLMNAGDELQQLSACFVDSPEDDIDDIHQTAKEAAQVFQCLTEESTVMVEEKGIISVADVAAGDRVAQRTDSGFQYKPVEETHTYEDAETLTVTLANGLSVRGTPNHRLMVDGEWTRLDEIQAGQEIHYALGWLREADREVPELTSVASGAQWSENRTVENAEILELYREDLSDYEIAERLDCGKSTVQRRRSNELDLPPNGNGGRKPGSSSFDESTAHRLYRDGHTDAEIADELDVHQATVGQFRAREQLTPNGTPVKAVSQPEQLTEGLAELVGLWVGDGSWHQNGVRFHVGRESIAEYIDELSQQLFGTSTSISAADGCYEVGINSHEIKRWWEANFDCKADGAQSARVPQVVKRAPATVVEAFLRGYFTADGTLLNDTYPKLYSSSERAIDDVATLMMGLGYPVKKSVIRDEDAHPYYGLVPTTGEGRKAFLREVGFIDERREVALSNIDSISPRDSHVIGEEYTVEVEAVTESEPATVYDITIEDNHEYVTDGIVSHNSGGGMGYAFWRLRPYGDAVGSTGGIASGPITFMRTYDQMCETIAQGGARRGAQMGVMRVSHPDVIQFIHAKNKDVSLAETLRLNDPDDYTHTSFQAALEEARELIDDEGRVPKHLRNAVEGHLSNFNISVGITDDFMEALQNGEEFTFTNPRTEEPHVATEETKELYEMFGLGDHVEVGEELSIPAEEIWDDIVEGAHENGEPGVIYLERVNKQHSFDIDKHPEHRILATNPCGEQPLEEYEACNLGHINLSTLADLEAPDWRVWYDEHGDDYDDLENAVDAFLEEAVDFEEFDRRIEMGTRFLENVVTMSDFPVEKIEQKVREMRKIGLGIMGLAQLYIQLGMEYGSEASNEVARQLMTHINHTAKWTSHELAEERGSFDEWDNSKYANPTEYREWFEKQTGLDADDWAEGFHIRNHNVTTIAPTGCVDEDSLVSTDEGLRPIKDLDNTGAEFEQWGEIEAGVSTDGGTKTATAVYDNGFADVRRIETEGGFSVASTPNHRFRTIDENGEYAWKEADDFEPGDHIVLQRNTFDGGSRADLDTSERENYYHNTDEDLQLPAEMTPELAAFLGYFMGDGYVHDEVGVKLVVESDAEELDAYLRELGESLFGVSPTVEDRDTRRVLCFGGRHLPRYFEDNGWEKADGNEGEGAASAFVPEEVLSSDEKVPRAFLRGLFEADGTAPRKVELSTVSETLAEQVQTLLLSLGCVFVREAYDADELGDDHFGERTRHALRGANKYQDERFVDEIGFLTKSLDVELTAQSYRNDVYPPAVVEALRTVDGYDSVSKSVKKRVNQSPINGSVSRKLVRDVEAETGETVRLDHRRLTNFYVATVDSVTEAKAYTKDISVPSNNTYIANGFVTHNTTSMVGNTTGGCEPIYNVAYYKNVSDDVQGDEMLVEFDDYFLRVLEDNDIDVDAVKEEAQEQMATNQFNGVEGLSTVPDAIGELFVTTGDLSAKAHAGVQVACQAGVDSAISKTVNAPNDSTLEDAKDVFEYIYEHGGKGVTYYRDGTRSKQVLTTRADNADFADETEAAAALVEQIDDIFGGLETFLENEDVQDILETDVGALADDPDEASEPEPVHVDFTEKRERPDALQGVSQRIDTGYGKIYVTINEDPETGQPFELFANIGHSGGFTNSFTEALAKVISTSLRSGVDPEEIVDELCGTRSPKVAWDKGEQIQSIPDAIGTAMRRYLDNEIDKPYPEQKTLEESADAGVVDRQTDGGATAAASDTDDTTQDLIDAGESPECPECGSLSLYFSEGCKTCESCGWSEC
ncbi:adenosylcobalamin-dependent ribonucleoside-diphosphate reductase [Salinadaptatus halalkaliphilus]|uniref:Vitamin B12-dependent ribonucleotide reductase n=1 Tax=Salinadaptatus halalkaliphilus TaxID=2419781 RepID=A0A4S3TPK2_9EURY|nr:adenosylcobalamin-dependent ribonucleoside-diphosphate reductase [Salinadaptatus halalkaliphilus]THE65620.1 adenosylcobalamin-dependent ribonucleoside-diphosphate reductase [Salinadaptatus halalkaliphilus]